MKWDTWEAIAKRQVRYRDALTARLAQWSEDKIEACTDMETLGYIVCLSERMERHQLRMNRHMDRALAAWPAGAVSSH